MNYKKGLRFGGALSYLLLFAVIFYIPCTTVSQIMSYWLVKPKLK